MYARATTDEGSAFCASRPCALAVGAVDTVAFNDEAADSYKQMLRSAERSCVVLAGGGSRFAFYRAAGQPDEHINTHARAGPGNRHVEGARLHAPRGGTPTSSARSCFWLLAPGALVAWASAWCWRASPW
ncbi:MAG: hypothetical protein ACLTDR_14935 [Adlercreutzia equolifaciens]